MHGTSADDVRLAPAALASGVGEILTLSPDDFRGLPDLALIRPAKPE